MKFTRKGSANWKGTGKEGSGTVSTPSTVLNQTPYSFKSRFEKGTGTNPEELIAAAHAGCFTMQFTFLLSEAGYNPTDLTTEAILTFEDGAVTSIHLELVGIVPEITESDFQTHAKKAKEICPISKLLNTEITLSTILK